MGTVIDSLALARAMARVFDIDRLQSAYRLRLSPDGLRTEWLGYAREKETLLTAEPDSSRGQRVKALLLGPFVPESLR